MNDLVQFLRDRLDDDERAARAVEDGSAPWDGQWVADGPDAVRTKNGHVLAYGHPLKPGLATHIAQYDPARILREVEAKRLILDRYADLSGENWKPSAPRVVRLQELRDAVCCLTVSYADHPDYRDEWRP